MGKQLTNNTVDHMLRKNEVKYAFSNPIKNSEILKPNFLGSMHRP
jgi:hypothetical protein